MDSFSNSILDDIVSGFPDLQNKHDQSADLLEFVIPSPDSSDFGALVITTTAEKEIWVRNYHPYSGYAVDTTEELIMIMKGVFTDDIWWVTGFKGDEWIETTLIKKEGNIEKETGATYHIRSWSGKYDKVI